MDRPGTQYPTAAQLVAAYSAAHYFASIGHREWLFAVGRPAADIERQLDADRYLFITAWNPAPRTATLAENMAADEALQQRLHASGMARHRALGSNAQGGAFEHGWLVLDAPLATADAWAREFGQAAILCWKHGEPVRLRMFWPRPDGIGDDPHIDWAG